MLLEILVVAGLAVANCGHLNLEGPGASIIFAEDGTTLDAAHINLNDGLIAKLQRDVEQLQEANTALQERNVRFDTATEILQYTVDRGVSYLPVPFSDEKNGFGYGGGGWTLIGIISSHDGIAIQLENGCDDLNWNYRDLWADATTLNSGNTDPMVDHKYSAYSTKGFTKFMMVENVKEKIGWKVWHFGVQESFMSFMQGGCSTVADSPVEFGGTITYNNAIIYSNNLKRNCNSDYVNNDDVSRLHGTNPSNIDGNLLNGGWGLGVNGDQVNCHYNSEARPMIGGWTTQQYTRTGFYTGGSFATWPNNKYDAGHFIGYMYVK